MIEIFREIVQNIPYNTYFSKLEKFIQTNNLSKDTLNYLATNQRPAIRELCIQGLTKKEAVKEIIYIDSKAIILAPNKINHESLCYYVRYNDLNLAPSLASLNSTFDVAKWYDSIIDYTIRTKEVKHFLQNSFLWKNKLKDPTDYLKRLLESRNDLYGYFYVATYFDVVKEFIDEKYKNQLLKKINEYKHFLPLLSCLTREEWPKDLEQKLNQLVSNSIYLPNIQPVKRTNHSPGNCECMEHGFDKTMFKTFSDYKGKSVLIEINGELIAAMKLYGDNSIIGLRNVTDKFGRLAIVEGGVYSTTKETRDKLINDSWDKINRIVGLQSIRLRPIEFLGTKYDEIEKYQKKARKFFKKYRSKLTYISPIRLK